ncbi:hypothetical protein [Prosthecobacter sp.]|uniref:hypothetical protein n=1 Tax=Prosthecobacter sp. TaxID=1965333 RepID=UPI003783E3BA
MALGTKNRLQQTAADCTAYLREQHRDQAGLVAEFIAEIEGGGEDVSRWQQFCDVRRNRAQMLERVEAAFQTWLAGG